MPEAVIVDAIRTPIGRAMKGSLKTVRADELAALPIRTLIERNPDVDFAQTNDVLMGAASGVGEQGYNIGRNAALLAQTTTSPAAPSTASARRRSWRSGWPPTPSVPARAISTSPPGSRPSPAPGSAPG